MDYTNEFNYSGNISPEVAGGLGLVFSAFFLFFLVIILAIYIYMAICLMKIAKKTNTENGWFAWIPILNIVLMVQISKKPMWWIVLFFIPIANIVAMIVIWMAIAENLGKPNWWGILMIIPIANLIVPGYLAFSGPDAGTNQCSTYCSTANQSRSAGNNAAQPDGNVIRKIKKGQL